MKKCNYCGRTEICKGSYPEGCFLENDLISERIKDENNTPDNI